MWTGDPHSSMALILALINQSRNLGMIPTFPLTHSPYSVLFCLLPSSGIRGHLFALEQTASASVSGILQSSSLVRAQTGF